MGGVAAEVWNPPFGWEQLACSERRAIGVKKESLHGKWLMSAAEEGALAFNVADDVMLFNSCSSLPPTHPPPSSW